MKKLVSTICLLALCSAFSVSAVFGQGAIKQGPDASTVRDPELEKDSYHNLEVARHYFKTRKAYLAAIARCEEIIAGHPGFSRIDEVLYIAGESSLRLADNKGKQAAKTSPDNLRKDAREYLSRLIKEFPDSTFREQAQTDLRALGGETATKKQ
ncbi:MAG: outer membrane protein assembly factor BamD [Pyrinomonadaceae bacterium]